MALGLAKVGLAAVLAVAVGQQPREHVRVDPQSRIEVAGTVDGKPFRCSSHEVTGGGELGESGEKHSTVPRLSAFALQVPVRSFACEAAGTTLRFRNVLKDGAFPTLAFRLDGFHALPAPSGQTFRLQAEGTLTAAGREQRVQVPMAGEGLPDGALRLTGTLPIRWSDFGLGSAEQRPASVSFDIRVRGAEEPALIADPPGTGG